MKTKASLIYIFSFILLMPNVYSQLMSNDSPPSSITFDLENKTSCRMNYNIEAGESDCTNCGGVSGTIDPNTTIYNIVINNDHSLSTTCDFLNWAEAYPVSPCIISTYAEDYNEDNCSGSDQHGDGYGTNCLCVDWDVTLDNISKKVTIE